MDGRTVFKDELEKAIGRDLDRIASRVGLFRPGSRNETDVKFGLVMPDDPFRSVILREAKLLGVYDERTLEQASRELFEKGI